MLTRSAMISLVDPSVLPKLIEQLPAVAAIIVVVMIFIRFLEGDRKVSREFFTQLHEAHLEARKQSTDQIHDNTEALRDNAVATTRNSAMINDLTRIIDRLDRTQK